MPAFAGVTERVERNPSVIATDRLPLQGSAFLLDVDADDGEGEAFFALLASEAVRRSKQPMRAMSSPVNSGA